MIFFCFFCFGQKECDLKFLDNNLLLLDKGDVFCLSKTNNKKTLVFTFGVWCSPCIKHLPNAIKLANDYDLNFYVLLVDEEESKYIEKGIEYLHKIDDQLKICFLKDATYGKKRSQKNKNFIKEITPTSFEIVFDMSKYILFDEKGSVIMVTNWKDNKGNQWDDDSEMIKRVIVPLL